MVGPVSAQAEPPTPVPTVPGLTRFSSGSRFLARVNVESLHVHRLPSQSAERVASLFKGEVVQVVSRSLDGSWFELRRVGRMSNLGWVTNDLIEWTFAPETLPLGDISTGVTGSVPLTSAPPIGVYLEEAPILRELPLRTGRRIMTVPALIVVPVIAAIRTRRGCRSTTSAIRAGFTRGSIRERGDVDRSSLPVPPGLPPPDTVPVVIIPLEIEQAQIDRLARLHRRTASAGGDRWKRSGGVSIAAKSCPATRRRRSRLPLCKTRTCANSPN